MSNKFYSVKDFVIQMELILSHSPRTSKNSLTR